VNRAHNTFVVSLEEKPTQIVTFGSPQSLRLQGQSRNEKLYVYVIVVEFRLSYVRSDTGQTLTFHLLMLAGAVSELIGFRLSVAKLKLEVSGPKVC
jgi:hypothetical protein